MELSFIIIDDSELDCFIAKKIIGNANKNIIVKSFQSGADALETIKGITISTPDVLNVILLDLQMPLMSGFEFVDEFEKISSEIREKCMLVVLSSTRNNNDIFRILTYPVVHSLMEKPLTREKLFTLIQEAGT
jgi:CheY-like chemotaxis protein